MISRLPIYPDTWFGICLGDEQIKVRSSAFYRPEKDGFLPEIPHVQQAGARTKKRRRSDQLDPSKEKLLLLFVSCVSCSRIPCFFDYLS